MSSSSDKSAMHCFVEGWNRLSVESLALQVTDGDHHTPNRSDDGVLLLSARNILNGRLRLEDVDFVSETEYQRMIKRCHPESGDLFVSCSGTIGRVCVVPENFRCALVRSVALVKLDFATSDPQFMAAAFQGNDVQTQIRAAQLQAAQPNLFQHAIRQIEINLPSIPQQRKIAKILTTVDNLIEKTEALIAKYQAIKQGMMHDLFTRGVDQHGHLRPTYDEAPELYKESELGWIPKEWDARTIGDVCETTSGGTPSRSVPSFWSGDIPWVKTGEIKYCLIEETEEQITEAGLKSSAARLLPKGTVVMALFGQGPTRGRVGMLGIDATVNQACLAFCQSGVIFNEYLYYACASAYDNIRQLSNDGAQQNLNASLVRGFTIPIPEVREQHLIVTILKAFESTVWQERKHLKKLQTLKTGLMQDLLTGNVCVKVDEVEEAADDA